MGWFSRKKAAPVEVPRKRTFAGAQSTARLNDFRWSNLSADSELESVLTILRGRARNLERNSPHAKRYIQLMQDNIVGPNGFSLQVRAAAFDGKSGALDVYGNAEIERMWKDWGRTSTADGLMDVTEMERMIVRTWSRDGEVIIQRRRGKKYGKLGLAYRFIEADQLDETLNRVYPGSKNRIRMGVEIDEDERPVAYHLLTQHPGDNVWLAGNNRKYIRVPAAEIIHVYVKSRPGQTRGIPPMSVVMGDMQMLGGYRDAEITNRRGAAAKMGFFERDADSGPVAGVADAETDDGQFEMEVEPGKMTVLPTGYKFNSFDASGSSTDYVGFERQIIRSIATGLGPSYFDLGMDLEDVSYSSIRQGALSDRDFYRGMQSFFISRAMMPIYVDFLNHALDFGDSGIPPRRFDKFFEASTFRPRGWSWVDPEKEVNAAIKAREGRMNSITRIVADQGGDFEDIAAEIAQEEQALAALGIPVVTKNEVAKQDVAKTEPVK